MIIDDIKKLNIPKSPGCYEFFNKAGKIIYVGKAVDLRSRVLSYWRESNGHSAAKHSMMKQLAGVEWIETDSEVEALLLEANLIKKHQPQYNVVMRDDKRYVYIKISTEEDIPRIFMTRNLDKSGRYFGPFVSTEAVRETLKVIRRIWPYRSCAVLPKKVCLYYRIGKCPGMCEYPETIPAYKKIIQNIILFLEGGKKQVIKNIESDIKKLSKTDPEGEEIRLLKYQLINIRKVLAHTNILSLMEKYAADLVELAKVLSLDKVPERIEGYDISNIFGREAVGSMVVFAAGEPDKSQYRKFKIRIGQGEANDTKMLKEVLERRFNNDWPAPDLIIIDGGKGQLSAGLQILNKRRLDINIISVSKGAGLRSAAAPDKVFFPGQDRPLVLPLSSPALHIIKRVRDEAHRFAVKYHRQLKRKKIFK